MGSVKEYYIKTYKEEAGDAFHNWCKDVSDTEDLFDAVDKWYFGAAEPNFAAAASGYKAVGLGTHPHSA